MGIIQSGVRFAKRQIKLIIGIVIGSLLCGIGSAAVFAAIPDGSGVIHACYSTGLLGTGAVRIIDSPSKTCGIGETAISWSSATPGQFLTNLAGADFTDTSLAYRSFAGADIHSSTFAGTTLNGADLSNANLSSSSFGMNSSPYDTVLARDANLTNTNFSNATIAGNIDFTNANLTNTNFSGTNWQSASITGGDFRQTNLAGANLGGSSFSTTNFSGYDFSGIHMDASSFAGGTDLSSANFSNAYEANGQLTIYFQQGSNANGANFSHANGIITNSLFQNTSVDGANFSGVAFQDSNLGGTDFSHANLAGVTWSNTVCPDGVNSNDNGGTCIGHLVP